MRSEDLPEKGKPAERRGRKAAGQAPQPDSRAAEGGKRCSLVSRVVLG